MPLRFYQEIGADHGRHTRDRAAGGRGRADSAQPNNRLRDLAAGEFDHQLGRARGI